MTPLMSVWLASLAGALSFFTAGFFLARRAHGEAAAADESVPPRVPPPVVEPPSKAAAADTVEPDLAALRSEVSELRGALREAHAREQAGADLELEAVRRLGELERLRDENAALRRDARAAAADRRRLAEVERELRELRELPSRSSVVAPLPRLPAGTAPPPAPGEPGSTTDQLSTLLHRLRGTNTRGIALSDEIGLPIVGLGDDASPLAALSGYLADIGRKARDFLPLGQLRRVIVEDENDTTITTCPQGGDRAMALVTLTVGPGPSARQMGDVLRSAADMLR